MWTIQSDTTPTIYGSVRWDSRFLVDAPKCYRYALTLHCRSKNSWYHSVFTLKTKVKSHGITVYSHLIQKYKLIISQCIHIEFKSKNSWYPSVFTLNTKVNTHGITVYSPRLQKYKLILSQCIHIEYKSKNSWYHSVFTLNTIKTRGITVGNIPRSQHPISRAGRRTRLPSRFNS
ncbi:hypothetical protein OUZ56_024276 [Daphnia magna]|uniref:Uncharacterized protein n=1 Tax=Daphnia magna TaxID=35525 RepID=A0ABR0B0I2_9CRUS|nr:hypothetical protein OUZ56_024276 [Daphnia magna]